MPDNSLQTKIKDLTVAQIVLIVVVIAVVLISSLFIDQLIKDWKTNSMCNEVYGQDGAAEIEACLQREADRQVREEK